MKHLLSISALLLVLFSCKKDSPQKTDNLFLEKIKDQLTDSVAKEDLLQLDFTRAIISKYEKEQLTLLRIPFKNKSYQTDFLLLKIEKELEFSHGKIIHLTRNTEDLTSANKEMFNGWINIYSLQKKLHTASPVKNGYVQAFHSHNNNVAAREAVAEALLPEVVLVASYANNDWNYSSWHSLVGLFNGIGIPSGGSTGSGGGGGVTNGYYTNSDYKGYNNNGGGGMPITEEPVSIDYEPVENLPAIDLAKYLKCFSSIPDAGATCTIEIYTDVPIDSDPNALMNWENGSPGHTFLKISKVNGSQRVQQNIGFYPVQGWKTALTPAPTKGKFADNFGHEFNASLSMNLTPDQLQSTLTHMLYLARFIQYDIDEYNCTDFALEVFNYKRGGKQLIIPKFDIPGGSAVGGTATPQGLYQKLRSMKDQAGPDSNEITIPGVKGFAGRSNGPCN